jgi:hypothetical protein
VERNRVTAPLPLSRAQILAVRRRVGALNERMEPGPDSLRRAAWAGLQDSMPRAALLSLHARVREIGPSAWDHPSLVQIWGPRYSAYVVAEQDRGPVRRGELWTSRVWPGAVMLDGEIRGTWRRANGAVTVDIWGRCSGAQRQAIEAEATSMPLPGLKGEIRVRWS